MKKIEDYTRVTDVLYAFSGLNKIPPEILKNAAARGTKVHEICDALINNLGFFDFDESVDGYIKSFNLWYSDKTFIKKPERFFCEHLKLTGECDDIYKEDNELVLVDFKTPAKESKTWPLQACAYQYLAEISGYKIKRVEFIKLDKKGNAPEVFVYNESFDKFLACYETYKYFYKDKQEENPLDYL